MIIVFDVGNSETTLGLYDGDRLAGHWRITTDVPRTADEFGALLRTLVNGAGVTGSIPDAAIGSVVPRVNEALRSACLQWLGVQRLSVVDATSPLPIRLAVDEPRTVGADRIINTLAASRLYGRDAIVVDLGTATTFDCITADGIFLGGVIAPGVLTSAETLFRRTSKLPATELVVPAKVIGTNTEECIRAGVLYGQADAIDGIVARIRGEWPGKARPIVVATGGLAETFKPLCHSFDRVEPYLTLEGLRMAHELLEGAPATSA